jgi:CDGSH-type Zn-finger protein
MAEIRVMANGPLLVSGVPLSRVVKGEHGTDGPPRWTAKLVNGVAETYALCRCGGSATMPMCDRWPSRPCFTEPQPGGAPTPIFTWRSPDAHDGPVVALKSNGPLRVGGGVPIEREDGSSIDPGDRVSLCRCGHSTVMPFCDSTHKVVDFRG